MVQALSDFRVRGVKTNIAFLERVMHHPDFRSGNSQFVYLLIFYYIAVTIV